jgi:hypothetical protein
MDSISADIVILPSPVISAQAIATSSDLHRFGTLTLLQDGKCYPHASLYMCQLRTKDLPKVAGLLEAIAHSQKALTLEATGYAQEGRFLDVSYARTAELDQLQQQVLDAVNPIRDGLRPQDEARLKTAAGQVLESLQKYGYRGTGIAFRPHVTLTRFKHEQEFDTTLLTPFSEFTGSFSALGLFEMGDNGTCVRQIAKFALQH